MTPHKQLYLHRPESGSRGDCWRTAIACLLDIEPIDVPHFYGFVDTEEEIAALTDAYLEPRGLRMLAFAIPGEVPMDRVLATLGTLNRGLHCLLSGSTARGTCHVVIARDGEIVHDTGLEDCTLVGPVDGWWWVNFLGARV